MTDPTPVPTPAVPGTAPVPGPLGRWYRTLIQAAGALVVMIPAEAGLFHIPAEKAAKYAGALAGAIAIISGIHNAINSKQS